MTPQEIADLKSAYKLCFTSNDGERVLEDLKTRCGFLRTNWSDVPNETYFREGQRWVVLWILDMLHDDNRKLPTQAEE